MSLVFSTAISKIKEKNILLLSLFVIYALFCWTETALFIPKGVVPFAFWICFFMGIRHDHTKIKKNI